VTVLLWAESRPARWNGQGRQRRKEDLVTKTSNYNGTLPGATPQHPDDESKPVDFRQVRHERAVAAYFRESDKLRSASWAALCDLWDGLADGLSKVPSVPVDGGQVELSTDPDVIFGEILLDLTWLAQANGADKKDIAQSLVDAFGLVANEQEALEHAMADMADAYVGRRLKVKKAKPEATS
jgi:hypothetical protein